jgi:hypothetical protein
MPPSFAQLVFGRNGGDHAGGVRARTSPAEGLLFISYSHRDETWRKVLAGHVGVLEYQGLVDQWDDRQLKGGDRWLVMIRQRLMQSRLAVLLVSSDFLTSKFIQTTEVPALFEQHAKQGMRIFPVLVRPCAWQQVRWLAPLQVRPLEAVALSEMNKAKRERALAGIASEVVSLLSEPLSDHEHL